ncbi:MAG: DNA lyase [Gammaproteobacteria bacterium]|nr:DNA lyase [Gammaproteobacteria bacterium]
MRLWSIHPGYLDAKGLVALWREGLLAQNVLLGNTKGYKNHPQLLRFKNTNNPTGAIASYLRLINDEAHNRGYNFNRSKIVNKYYKSRILVTSGQVEFEFKHLLSKLKTRDPDLYKQLKMVKRIKLHPLFKKINGNIEEWENIQ